MKISKIRIQNFRSIKEAEIDCCDFNTFVGQNNSGKTNLFEAVEFFYNGLGRGISASDISFGRDPENEVMVELTFTDALDGVEKMKNEKNATAMKSALGDNNIVSIKRTSKDAGKRKITINGIELTKPPTGFDAALNDFLPKFEYIHTRQFYDALVKYSKTTPIGAMLSSVMAVILESSVQYKEFQEKFNTLFGSKESDVRIEFDTLGEKVKINLEKQFPDCTKVRFEVTEPVFEDLLKNFETSVDDGIETLASEKGDGMQRALMLAIIQAYAEFRRQNEDIGKSFLFFIDEAELHLHPTAQRKLKNVLIELCEGIDQVFINTHSSVLVADNHSSQQIFKVEKSNKVTVIQPTDEADKEYIIFELLGGSPADLLLPNNFLIVEGSSELELITAVIKRFYGNKPKIQVIAANGDTDQAERTINAIEHAFKPLNKSLYGNKVVILCDKPSVQREGGVNDFKSRHKTLVTNNQLLFLPTCAIETYYPQPWHRTETEEDAMNGKKKVQLGKRVGKEITQVQFETDLKVVFDALNECWSKAIT
jgi:putative ATP-dependent endonuclease of the OLD family